MNPPAIIGRWLLQTLGELAKTVTPTPRSLIGWTIAGLMFTITLMLLITGTDWMFGRLTLLTFG